MLRIVTDSAADYPEEWLKEYAVEVCPINIQFGNKTYVQGKELDNEGFYRLVEETKKIPKTSQPSPHQFIELYNKIAQPGETIISIHVTSKLSGTFASAEAAARELAGTYNVVPFDSLNGSVTLGFMCRAARLMDRAGKSLEEIIKQLEYLRQYGQLAFALDTLEYARMSGRVGAMQAALASVLNIKPIALLKDGILEMTDKVRTRQASLERLVDTIKEKVGDKPQMIGVVHARDPKAADQLVKTVRASLNVRELVITELTISLAANFGPGTVGIIALPAE